MKRGVAKATAPPHVLLQLQAPTRGRCVLGIASEAVPEARMAVVKGGFAPVSRHRCSLLHSLPVVATALPR